MINEASAKVAGQHIQVGAAVCLLDNPDLQETAPSVDRADPAGEEGVHCRGPRVRKNVGVYGATAPWDPATFIYAASFVNVQLLCRRPVLPVAQVAD